MATSEQHTHSDSRDSSIESDALSASSSSDSSKDEDFVKIYDIFITYSISDGFVIESTSLVDGRQFRVCRDYEEFQLFHHNLIGSNLSATIVPPLPEMCEPEEKQFPQNHLKIIKECNLMVENVGEFGGYLRALISHNTFGSNKMLEEFLTMDSFMPPESSLSTRAKQANFFNFSSDKWKYSHKDCDEFYEKERFFVTTMFEKLGGVKSSFENVLINNRKLCNVIAHFSTSLTSNLVIKEPEQELALFNKMYCSSLDSYKTYLELEGTLSHHTLGVVWQYLFAYNIAYKEMLFRRLELMINYENANKNFERSIDSKNHEKASTLKKITEYEFEQFSECGRHEIKRYHRYRTQQLLQAINCYVNSQLIIAKKTANLFRNCITNLKKYNYK